MWVHDEERRVPDGVIERARAKCINCGNVQKKYIKSWYTGGIPCALRTRYCERCGSENIK